MTDCTPRWVRPAPTVLEMRGIRFLAPVDDPDVAPDPKADKEEGKDSDKALGEGGEKALKAERAARVAAEKRAAALEADAQKRADAELSEVERLKKENAELANKAGKAERDALRSSVGHAKKLDPEFAALLAGSTREEMEAHADRLIAAMPTAQSTGKPRPDPSQGPTGTTATSVQTGRAIFADRHKKTS